MIAHRPYIDFLMETGLTQAEFLFLFLIYKEDKKGIAMYKDRFPTEDGTMIGKLAIKQLKKEGWIDVDSKNQIEVTDKFLIHLVKDELALEELIEIFPPFYFNGKTNIPLVTVDKHIYSLKYGRKINYSFKEHQEVIKDLQYGINNNLITFGLAKFIDSDYWKSIRKLREETPVNQLSAFKDHNF